MIKLEQELVDAIRNKQDFKKRDLEIRCYRDKCYVYLKDRNIAVIDYKFNYIKEIRLYSQGLFNKVTKSRLNAILTLFIKESDNEFYTYYSIYQHKSQWYLSCCYSNGVETKVIRDDVFEEGISIKVNE